MATTEEQLSRWASELASFQKHLIASGALGGELPQEEIDRALAMLKQAHDLEVDVSVQGREIDATAFAAKTADALRLCSLTNFTGIGTIPDGTTLQFEVSGITIAYGENAAGKTSYSRVLKFVGRSAHRDNQILSNVFDTEQPERQVATAMVPAAGGDRPIEIDLAIDPPAELSSIRVFDSQSAINFVRDKRTVDFTPEQLTVFNQLVSCQGAMRKAVDEEIVGIQNEAANFEEFTVGTSVQIALAAISPDTKIDQFEALSKLDETETKRFLELKQNTEVAGSGNGTIDERTQSLVAEATSVEALSKGLTTINDSIGRQALVSLKQLETNSKDLAAAAATAKTDAFAEETIAEIGSDTWKELWASAKRFADHAGEAFPPHAPDEPCPVCLRPVDEATEKRLERFDQFVQSDTSVRAAAAAASLLEAREKQFDENLVSKERTPLLQKNTVPALKAAGTFLDDAQKRLEQCRASEKVIDLGDITAAPTDLLVEYSVGLRAQATALEELKKGDALKAARNELAELSDRALLAGRLDDVRKQIERSNVIKKLGHVRTDLDTTSLTNKQKQLAEAPGLVIIGRRDSTRLADDSVRHRLSRDKAIRIQTYDWLLEAVEGRIQPWYFKCPESEAPFTAPVSARVFDEDVF